MSFIRSSSSKFMFSMLLVIVQWKVCSNLDAASLQNIFNLGSFSIEGVDHESFNDLPHALLQAAPAASPELEPEPQPKISARAKLKIMAAEVVQKMKEFYDLLADEELIETEEAEQRVDDFDSYLTTREVPPGNKDSLDGAEFSNNEEEFSDSLDKPKPMNAGQKIKKVAKDVSEKVKEMFENMKKPKDDQPRKESLGTRTKKMFSNTGKIAKDFYNEKIKKTFKKLMSWRFQLDIEVKPLSSSRAQPEAEAESPIPSQSESQPQPAQ